MRASGIKYPEASMFCRGGLRSGNGPANLIGEQSLGERNKAGSLYT